jgi:NADH dehydrogenase ubiquinone Fe-S protein 4
MVARIYQPARNAMQSGQANTRSWVLDYTPGEQRLVDPLMGWTGSGDTQSQVRLSFDTKEEAIAYANKHGLVYQVAEPHSRKMNIRPGGYGDNFAYSRRGAWTH